MDKLSECNADRVCTLQPCKPYTWTHSIASPSTGPQATSPQYCQLEPHTLKHSQHIQIFGRATRATNYCSQYLLSIEGSPNPSKAFASFPPTLERSLLQGSPFPGEGTEVPSPRRGVSLETPPSRESKAFHSLTLPGRSMLVHAPLRDGARELHLPSLYPRHPNPPEVLIPPSSAWTTLQSIPTVGEI